MELTVRRYTHSGLRVLSRRVSIQQAYFSIHKYLSTIQFYIIPPLHQGLPTGIHVSDSPSQIL